MKLLKKLLAISSLFLFVSCASLPEKPVVELGVIDYPANEVIVNNTGGQSIQATDDLSYAKLTEFTTTASSGRVPLSSYDRAISFKPMEWEKVQNYIKALEGYAKNSCNSR